MEDEEPLAVKGDYSNPLSGVVDILKSGVQVYREVKTGGDHNSRGPAPVPADSAKPSRWLLYAGVALLVAGVVAVIALVMRRGKTA